MKYLSAILLLLLSLQTRAQSVSGYIVDKATRKPLKYVIVSTSVNNTVTSKEGGFALKITKLTDTIRINLMGYKPYSQPVSPWSGRLKIIELEEQAIKLNEVNIVARRNFIRDSVNNRREFAKEFAFKGPSLTEIMRPTATNVPFAFVTVDVLSLINLLTKKKNPQYRFQQTMLRDEKTTHISQRFNRDLVTRITGLKGDSLEKFMSVYQPAPTQIDLMTDYNLVMFIKDSYLKYKTTPLKPKLQIPTLTRLLLIQKTDQDIGV